MRFLTLIILSIFITACGNNSSSSSSSPNPQNQEAVEGDSLTEGKYRAFLRPLNTSVYGFINSGKAEITITERTMKVNLLMDDAPAVIHMQGIHEGTQCPDLSADRNGDQYIDILEENAVTGGILIPLDGDLSAQDSLKNQYPSGKSYTYNEETSVKDLINDLWANDNDPQDLIVKLPVGTGINIQNKVIIIRGAPASTSLPASVQTIPGLTPQASIPIACGIIEKI